MVYEKKLRLLVIADAALVVLIALGIVFSPRSSESRATRRDLLKSAADVSSIRIEGAEKVELMRSGDGWAMTSPDGALPADGPRVEAFLKAVDAVSRLEPVAKDKKSWAKLGLDGESARHIVLSSASGTNLGDFILGNYASSPGAVYLALSSGPESYSAASGMVSYALGKRASWLDLRAWSSPPAVENVQEMSVRGSVAAKDGSARPLDYTVTRSGSGWASGDTILDNAKVESMIRALAALRGDDYAPAAETKGEPPVSVVPRP